jgi:hypothetical protein
LGNFLDALTILDQGQISKKLVGKVKFFGQFFMNLLAVFHAFGRSVWLKPFWKVVAVEN